MKTWRRVCVIGDKIAEDLFGSLNPVGREVKLNGERYTVIGAMKPRSFFGRDWGNQIVVPVTTLQKRVVGNDYYSIIFVYVENAAHVKSVTRDIRKVLKRLHKRGDAFRVDTGERVLENVDNVTLIMKLVAGGIAGHFPDGGGDWHYEYHARVGDGTHARNRHSQGHWGPSACISSFSLSSNRLC